MIMPPRKGTSSNQTAHFQPFSVQISWPMRSVRLFVKKGKYKENIMSHVGTTMQHTVIRAIAVLYRRHKLWPFLSSKSINWSTQNFARLITLPIYRAVPKIIAIGGTGRSHTYVKYNVFACPFCFFICLFSSFIFGYFCFSCVLNAP